jgi:hypothetical protein
MGRRVHDGTARHLLTLPFSDGLDDGETLYTKSGVWCSEGVPDSANQQNLSAPGGLDVRESSSFGTVGGQLLFSSSSRTFRHRVENRRAAKSYML